MGAVPRDGADLPQAVLADSSGSLPSNLSVPAPHRALLLGMWQHSARFRRQLARIAASDLVVRLRFEGAAPVSARACATTSIQRRRGQPLAADVRIGCASRVVELIAHELEHVIEQLEGVALDDLARRTPAIVVAAGDAFETRRAIEAGRTVALEVKGASPQWLR